MKPQKPTITNVTPIKIAVSGLLADHIPYLKNTSATKPISKYYL